MLPSKICYFWCICVSILFTGRSEKQGCALRKISRGLEAGGGGGVTLVNLCWVCAADLPEPLPHFSLFWGQI